MSKALHRVTYVDATEERVSDPRLEGPQTKFILVSCSREQA